jgi:drug/metabolite transporter (DMT)-like permease
VGALSGAHLADGGDLPAAIGLRVLRTKRPLWQLARALCLLGTSLFFTTALLYIPLAEATAVNFLAPVLVTALSVPLLANG